MSSRRVLTFAAAAAVIGLSGCAGGPSVDLDAAKAWADEVVAAESDGPGAAGTGLLKAGPGEHAGVQLTFAHETTLVRVDVRCYGDDDDDLTATVTAVVTSVGGGVDDVEREVPCDREPHEMALDSAAATAIEVRATAAAETYVHATVIQGLVIERE